MPVTAKGVIHAARDRHPAFDPESTPDGSAMRFLTGYQQRLLTQIAQIRPDAVVETQEFDIPPDWEDGDAIEPHILVHGGEIVYKGRYPYEEQPLNVVQYIERLTAPPRSAYIQRERLYLLGSEVDWNGVMMVRLHYFPQGSTLVQLTDEVDLPGQSFDPCVAAVADFMADRVGDGISSGVRAKFAANAEHAEERYIDEITKRRRARVGRAKEVW